VALQLADVRGRVRQEAGNPKTDEVSDDDIDKWIDEGLDFLGRYVPAWTTSSITTVKDQQEYSVESDCLDIVFCDWAGTTLLSDVFGDEFDVITGKSIYDVELDQYKMIVEAMTKRQITDRYEWEFNPFDNKLWLIPPPSASGDKVYYVYLVPWSLSTIPTRYEKYVVKYAVIQAVKQKARRGRRESAIAHRGDLVPWTQADPSLQDARTAQAELERELLAEGRKYTLFW